MYGVGLTTLQAYNNYGGRSLYDFNSFGSNTVAGTPRAVKVSFDRPYEQPRSGLRDWYTNTELATVAFLEQNGYDVGYISDGDLDTNATLLATAKAYVSPAHEEYVLSGMRTALENARTNGVSLFFTGSNEMYWRIRLSHRRRRARLGARRPATRRCRAVRPTPAASPRRRGETRTGRTTPRTPSPARCTSETTTTRASRSSSLLPRARIVSTATPAWTRRLRAAPRRSVSTCRLGWDARVANGAEPAGVKTLAGSPVSGQLLQGNGASYLQNQTATTMMVKYKAASGALVVTTWTNHWNRGLARNADGVGEPTLKIQQVTVNVLQDMGVRPATPIAGIQLDPAAGVGPPAPTGVTAKSAGSDSVTLSWAVVTGAGYNVYRTLGARDAGYPRGQDKLQPAHRHFGDRHPTRVRYHLLLRGAGGRR